MARPVIMALGAAGTLAAAATGVVVIRSNDQPTTLARGASSTVCIASNVRLVEGMTQSCLTSAQYEALRDRAVLGGDGETVEVTLTGASDGAQAQARTCAEYDALIDDGAYAMSTADMRRAEYFQRACGALDLLVDARPARKSHFAGGSADASDVRSMAIAEATGFGETSPSTSVDVDEISDGVWKVTTGDGETTIFEIAHADFDGDGLGEILAYVSIGAAGGSARSGQIGFIEKPSAGGPCAFRAG